MNKEKTSDEINLLDYLIVFAKNKMLIIKVTLSFAIITAIISLILPPVFKAETVIMPPKDTSSGIISRALARFGGGAQLARSALGIKNESMLYVGILKGRTITDKIIYRFGLIKKLKPKYIENLREILLKKVEVDYETQFRLISITVKDKDPKIAADMANAYVDELKKLLKRIAVTEASQRRIFFEEQLKQITEDLIKSEDAMKEFQERTGILNSDILMPAVRIPAVATEFLRKMRDVKYNEKLFEITAEQYEMARMDEARDSAIIQVVDKAVPPERRSWPLRKLMVIIAAFMGFFISLVIISIKEYMDRQTLGSATTEKIEKLKTLLPFKRKKSS